ncbi:ABC-transporter extracellular N-terminal-domain-containing protein [Aspergillus spectabilis]
MEEEIEEMARQLTRRSTHFSTSNAKNPFFEDNEESTLHPGSPSFKVKDWIRSLLAAQAGDPERFRQRSAGVAFKNLSVHGFGSATDYQKDVFNAISGVAGMVRKLTKTGLQILNEFNGLVRSGEMLVVLGRPGR